MSDYTQTEIDRLDEKLKGFYVRGRLTAQEKIEVDGLWARIERLQTAAAAQVTKEHKVQQALRAAKEAEGME